MPPVTLDDSEAVRLEKLLEDNGFEVMLMKTSGYEGRVDRIELVVYPRYEQNNEGSKGQST